MNRLNHCGVSYFDYYLLHNMGTNVYEKCRKYDAFGFVAKKKDEGKIRQVGMSFHDTPQLLDEILARYGGMLDFIRLATRLCRIGSSLTFSPADVWRSPANTASLSP